MALPVIILHGWSDGSESFASLAGWLKDNGFQVVDIYLGDYLSMNDEITLFDLGSAFQQALKANNLAQTRFSFDAIVHSTGGLVVREYLRQICNGDASKTPIRHLCMMSPANFGSPLARLGNSVLGRLFKGWSFQHFGQTGTQILNTLELASPYSWALAENDLFNPGFNVFDPRNTLCTVVVGTVAYPDALRSSVHENGSDGTVRVSTANLNAHFFSLDFTNPDQPSFVSRPRNAGAIALAVFQRDHSAIHDPNDPRQTDLWRQTVLSALAADETGYAAHVQRCQAVTAGTFADGMASGKILDWFHQYQHVVFRVRDQFGQPIPDYIVEFYQEEDDDTDQVFKEIHGEILEKVTTNATDASYRSFLFDTTDLNDYLDHNKDADIQMSLSAADLSSRIVYRNPRTGVDVFTVKNRSFIFPNEPVLVDVTLYRDQTPEVFKLTRFSK